MSNQMEGAQTIRPVEALAWEPFPAHTPSLPGIGFEAETRRGDAAGNSAVKLPYVEPAHASAAEKRQGNFLMARRKEKMEMPICTRVSVSTYRALEVWCDNSFRKRSEVVGLVLERIVEILAQQKCMEQPVEEFVRRLWLAPRS